MGSSFMGLYVQREALVTAQKALDITGNNISNVKTEGYSRQRVDVCSVANKGYNLLYNTSVSMAGQGVDVVGVTQLRDSLLDEKVRKYTTSSSEYNVKDQVMSDVETALDNIEAEESGLATNLAKFKEALQSFSADNSDRKEVANVAMNAAKSVAEQIRYLDDRLNEISDRTLEDAKASVTAINTILENMGKLNEEITTSYISMGYISSSSGNYIVDNDYGPLELKDKMNMFIDQLSEYGNVTCKEENNGSFTITFAGQLVVYNDTYAQTAMTEIDPDPLNMAFVVTDAGTYDQAEDRYVGLMKADDWRKIKADNGDSTAAYVRNDPNAVDITGKDKIVSGSLRGYLDTFNGEGIYAADDGNKFQGIEYYRDMLNSLAKTMTEELNGIFENFTMPDGSPIEVFTYADGDGNDTFRTAAENFRVASAWENDPSIIAHPETPDMPLEELDNSYINKMLGVFADAFQFGYVDADGTGRYDPQELNFEKFVAHISDNLGTQVEGNGKLKETTDIMLDSVVNARDEVMAVSINEEGINMMNYQKWYNAIARMVTTLDQALDKLINGTGLVGLQ